MNRDVIELSIIVCTYNRAVLLAETLSCLLRQTAVRDGRAELLVVDNNSTDTTRAVVEEAVTQLPELVRYVHESRQGLSFARNRGIREARGTYIAFTDDDCLVGPEWAAAIIDTFETQEAVCVFGKILPLWPTVGVPSWLRDNKRLWGNLALLDYGDELRKIQSAGSRFYGANFAVAKSCFNKVGTFNIKLGRMGKKLFSGEDVDLFERLVALNESIIYNPQIVVSHKIEKERINKSYFRRWNFSAGVSTIESTSFDGRCFIGVPFYVLRQLIMSVCRSLSAFVRLHRQDAFFYQLMAYHNLGLIWACIKKWAK